MSLWHLKYAAMCARRIPKAAILSPRFTAALTLRRALFTISRRFVGPPLRSPITGEVIFNRQSLINAFAMQIVGELDGPWQEHLRETPAPVVFDVGSNIGQFRAFALSFNPCAKVYTWDCWEEMAAYVPAEFHRPFALGRCVSIGEMQMADIGWTASTSLGYYEGSTRQVLFQVLDDEWVRLGRPVVDVLKIDVDGAEFNVLLGAQETLRRTKHVLVETDDLPLLKVLCPGRTWTASNNYDFCGSL